VCPEFDVAQLADHLIGTVTFLGAAASAGAGSGVAASPGPLKVRAGGSFAEPIEAGPDAGLLGRLVAFTGRNLH
jgi:hypothetical protein